MSEKGGLEWWRLGKKAVDLGYETGITVCMKCPSCAMCAINLALL